VARTKRPSERAPRSCASGTCPALACFNDEDTENASAEASVTATTTHVGVTAPTAFRPLWVQPLQRRRAGLNQRSIAVGSVRSRDLPLLLVGVHADAHTRNPVVATAGPPAQWCDPPFLGHVGRSCRSGLQPWAPQASRRRRVMAAAARATAA